MAEKFSDSDSDSEYREWTQHENSRGYLVTRCEGEHVSLSELKVDPNLDNRYLRRTNIPPYPRPVTFYASEVSHVTEMGGLMGIFRDSGFCAGQDTNFLWWSLSVSKADTEEAEENFLSLFPGPQAEYQQPFLHEFTTSPAFQDQSRYGNFRFTFPLKELLHFYSRQFCYRSAPVLRVLDTKIYKKEIMYSVLVHPRHISYYNHYPKLPRDEGGVCGYFQGSMWWTCQAPSSAHGRRLWFNEDDGFYAGKQKKVYYVWDHVAVAFHMEPNWVLRRDRRRLFSSASVCDVAMPNLQKDPGDWLTKGEAEDILDVAGLQYGLN